MFAIADRISLMARAETAQGFKKMMSRNIVLLLDGFGNPVEYNLR